MLIPSIDLIGGHAVQLEGGDPEKLRVDGGVPWAIAERFGRVGEIAVIDLDAAMKKGSNRALILELAKKYACRVGGGIRDVDSALELLDAGAEQVILGTAARPEILGELPRESVSAALDAVNDDVVVEGWTEKTGRTVIERMRELREYAGHFLVTFVEREGQLKGVDLDRVAQLKEEAGDCALTVAGGVATADEIAAIDAMSVDAQVGMALYTGKIGLGDAGACVFADDEVPTVLVDQHQRVVACDVATREYVSRAIESGTLKEDGDVFEAWNGLAVESVTADAARRSAMIRVRVEGDGMSGFTNRVKGVAELARMLGGRYVEAPAGSYTRRLFDDPELLRSKLAEEANELMDA
ncbi:MAG: HisA/HisF-related TIM barrel protein, partial [Planctomycetota bacterium]